MDRSPRYWPVRRRFPSRGTQNRGAYKAKQVRRVRERAFGASIKKQEARIKSPLPARSSSPPLPRAGGGADAAGIGERAKQLFFIHQVWFFGISLKMKWKRNHRSRNFRRRMKKNNKPDPGRQNSRKNFDHIRSHLNRMLIQGSGSAMPGSGHSGKCKRNIRMRLRRREPL